MLVVRPDHAAEFLDVVPVFVRGHFEEHVEGLRQDVLDVGKVAGRDVDRAVALEPDLGRLSKMVIASAYRRGWSKT